MAIPRVTNRWRSVPARSLAETLGVLCSGDCVGNDRIDRRLVVGLVCRREAGCADRRATHGLADLNGEGDRFQVLGPSVVVEPPWRLHSDGAAAFARCRGDLLNAGTDDIVDARAGDLEQARLHGFHRAAGRRGDRSLGGCLGRGRSRSLGERRSRDNGGSEQSEMELAHGILLPE